jgi:hypothetical protein
MASTNPSASEPPWPLMTMPFIPRNKPPVKGFNCSRSIEKACLLASNGKLHVRWSAFRNANISGRSEPSLQRSSAIEDLEQPGRASPPGERADVDLGVQVQHEYNQYFKAKPRSKLARCPRSDRTGVRCRSTAGSCSREHLFFGGCQPERRSGSWLRAGWQATRCRPGSPPV